MINIYFYKKKLDNLSLCLPYSGKRYDSVVTYIEISIEITLKNILQIKGDGSVRMTGGVLKYFKDIPHGVLYFDKNAK